MQLRRGRYRDDAQKQHDYHLRCAAPESAAPRHAHRAAASSLFPVLFRKVSAAAAHFIRLLFKVFFARGYAALLLCDKAV